jgi:hypothetical protein
MTAGGFNQKRVNWMVDRLKPRKDSPQRHGVTELRTREDRHLRHLFLLPTACFADSPRRVTMDAGMPAEGLAAPGQICATGVRKRARMRVVLSVSLCLRGGEPQGEPQGTDPIPFPIRRERAARDRPYPFPYPPRSGFGMRQPAAALFPPSRWTTPLALEGRVTPRPRKWIRLTSPPPIFSPLRRGVRYKQ